MASQPVNRTAAIQLARGEEWQPRVKLQDYYEDMPPIKAADIGAINSGTFRDFTGERFGHLVVIGMLDKRAKPASWVCRCVCGGYCTRASKSLRAAETGVAGFVGRCGRCSYQAGLRDGLFPGMRNYDGGKK